MKKCINRHGNKDYYDEIWGFAKEPFQDLEKVKAGFDYLRNLPAPPLPKEAETEWLTKELEKLNKES